MGTPDAEGHLARHVDDSIGAMVYSMIGEPSVEAQLRHHLALAQKSLCSLHAQLKDLQLNHRSLEGRYDRAKVEVSMNATALRQNIGEFNVLKGSYERLLKECELFRNDREVFAEAAEDAEERRAEADKRAVEAEVRAMEAEQRENAVVNFIETVLKTPPRDKLHVNHTTTAASPEVKASWAVIKATENPEMSCSLHKNHMNVEQDITAEDQRYDLPGAATNIKPNVLTTIKQAGLLDAISAQSPASGIHKKAKGTKRVLFEACRVREEITNVVRQRTCKNALMDRSKLTGEICKIGRLQALSPGEKENFNHLEAETRAKIEEAARSDNETVRYLADLLVILKRNLVKAEAEGDLIYSKYCEIHKLLMDTVVTLGILPEVYDGKVVAPSNAALEGLEEHDS